MRRFGAEPGATANTANCGNDGGAVGNLTDVGSYTSSPSPFGTFAQGGNISELTETIFGTENQRIVRGGKWNNPLTDLTASTRRYCLGEGKSVGFRVASVVPEPSTSLLLTLGLVGLESFA